MKKDRHNNLIRFGSHEISELMVLSVVGEIKKVEGVELWSARVASGYVPGHCRTAGGTSNGRNRAFRQVPGRSAGIKRYPVLGTPGSYGDRTRVFWTLPGTSPTN